MLFSDFKASKQKAFPPIHQIRFTSKDICYVRRPFRAISALVSLSTKLTTSIGKVNEGSYFLHPRFKIGCLQSSLLMMLFRYLMTKISECLT